jgi:hypothetical protein
MNIRKDDIIELIKHLDGTHKCEYCYYNYSYQCTLGKTCDTGIEHFMDFKGNSLRAKLQTAKEFNQMIKEHRKNNAST